MTEYKNVKGLAVAADGSVFFQLREVFPDKTGVFASKNTTAGGITSIYVTSEEIIEAWGNDEKVSKSLDRQIKRSNLSLEQLTKWKSQNDDLKYKARTAGKSEYQIRKMKF